MIRTKFSGIPTVDYRESFRDFANGRRWNKTTQTWKTTVPVNDAKQSMAEISAPFVGTFRGTHTGLGTPGIVRRYVHNEANGRVVHADNLTVADGAFANAPDAADTTNAAKLRVELIGATPGLGDTRFKARLDDETSGETWNAVASAWQPTGSVSASDALFFLAQDPLSEYASVYAAFVAGLGQRNITATFYDAVANPALDQPLFQEDMSAVQAGGVVTPSGLFHKVEALRAHGVVTVATRLNPDREPVLVLHTEPGTSPVLLARIADGNKVPVTPDDLLAVEYTVFERRDADLAFNEHLDGHTARILAVSDVVLPALVNDDLWNGADEFGYNFRHQPDISDYDVLPDRSCRYDIEYKFTPATGQVFRLRYVVRT